MVLINYLPPKSAFGLLMALVVATLLLEPIMICPGRTGVFAPRCAARGRETQFKALPHPAGNYICIARSRR